MGLNLIRTKLCLLLTVALAVSLLAVGPAAAEYTEHEGLFIDWEASGGGEVTFDRIYEDPYGGPPTYIYKATMKNEAGFPITQGTFEYDFKVGGPDEVRVYAHVPATYLTGACYYLYWLSNWDCYTYAGYGYLYPNGHYPGYGDTGHGEAEFFIWPNNSIWAHIKIIGVDLRCWEEDGEQVCKTVEETETSFSIQINIADDALKMPAENYGDPEQHPFTVFDGGESGKGPAICLGHKFFNIFGPGLPRYWVNTATLNLVVQDTEFSTSGLAPRLAFSRTYNSASSGSGMFGRGWSFAYESRMLSNSGDENGTVFYSKGSGQWETYIPSSQVTNPDSSVTVTYEPISEGRFDKLEGIFTGIVSESYYLFEEKSSRLTHRYDHAGTDGEGNQVYRQTSIADRNGNTVVLAYNGDGALASVTDVAGRATSFAYDANDRCISMTVPGGGAATYSYDTDGHLIQSVDLAANISTFTYNTDHAMTSLSTGGKTTTFSYDESGGWKHVSSIVDALGKTTGYSANDSGLVTITEPGGGTMKYGSSDGKTTTVTNQLGVTVSTTVYNDDGLPSSVTFADGSSVTYEYDTRGNVTRRTGATGGITQFTYDSDDNLTRMIDPMGKSWNYAYDSKGNLISETTPLGRTTTYTRDAKGLITRTTLPDGAKIDFAYDAKGNMTSETDPTGKATTHGYDAQGLELTSITNPRGYTTSFQYDANRRMTKTTFPDGKSITYGYDCCAPTTITDQDGKTTTTSRNALLWVTSETDPMGNATTMAYNDDGKGISLSTPLKRTATFGYDAAHRLTSSTAPGGQTVFYGYNNRNNLTVVTDEKGKTTAMSYDAEGRLASVTDPLNETTRSLTRDALGRISAFTNARGQTVSYEYDDDGRITKKKHQDATVATYGYTTNGYFSSVNDSWGTTSMSYDAAGRVTQIGYPTEKTLGVAYDNGGNIASLSYPGGLTATYSYDNLNRLTRVDFGGEFISFAYDAVWNLTGETRSNGVTSTYTADANHRLISLKSSKGTSTILSQTCTHDKDGRITSESGVHPLAPDLQATSVSATYNAANELITMGSNSYTYDDDGNLTTISGSRSLSAVYDSENRPTSITLGGTARTYLYDGLGRRVRIQSGGKTRNLHHDHLGRLLFETNASGQLSALYIYAGGLLVAQGDGSGNYLFPLRDKTGSTLALTDQSGSVVAAYAYGPYGASAGKNDDATTPFTYVGAFGVMDEGDDLYFMRNRYYDAVSGRFLQRDPIGFEGGQTNLYAYVGNNPINLIDPSGTSLGAWGEEVPDVRPPLDEKSQYRLDTTVFFMDNFCHQYVENLNDPNTFSPFYWTDKALTYVSPVYTLFSASLKFCAGEYWDGFITGLGAIGWKNAGRSISAWSDTTSFLSWLYFREPIDIPNPIYTNPSLTINGSVIMRNSPGWIPPKI